MGLIGKLGGSLASGMLGNMSEVSVEDLTKEYGAYSVSYTHLTLPTKRIV